MNASTPDTDIRIDHTIDRALSALRDAQPRSGLNGRILASVEHRAATPAPARLAISAHFALWAATSCAVLAIAWLTMLHHSAPTHRAAVLSEASQSDAQSKNPATARPATSPEPLSASTLTHTTPNLSSRPERAPGSPASSLAGVKARSGETPVFADARAPKVVDLERPTAADLDAQALADFHAPSHPAPPLPMTAQEKLFRRMVQYRNATQLAELNPAIRARENADETTAFKAFFPDPPPLDQSTGDNE